MQLHNVIEHIFHVLKNHFCILWLPPEYNSDIQAHIPLVLCLVHNVICIHDPDKLVNYHDVKVDEWSGNYDSGILTNGPPTEAAHICTHDVCDEISQLMWDDYLAERQCRGAPVPPGAN